MTAFQQWLENRCIEFFTWLWGWIGSLAYWACAIGMILMFLSFIVTKNKKDLNICVRFILAYVLIVAVKLGCGY